jgi:hypothetical protein
MIATFACGDSEKCKLSTFAVSRDGDYADPAVALLVPLAFPFPNILS